jgi:8-oxoguanine deaminase
MSVGASAGGLPPDSLVEDEADILADSERLIERGTILRPRRGYSWPSLPARRSQSVAISCATRRSSRVSTVSACTRTWPRTARTSPTAARFRLTPGEYAEDLGWLGPDVWHAHCVQLDDADIQRFAASGTGVAHCPCSNMRLASGVAPVMQMLRAGVPVALGVDGSSSNDSGHLLAEARQALLLQRLREGAEHCAVRDMLRVATRGGARVLGRDTHMGQLSAGFQADCAAFAVTISGTPALCTIP